MSSKFPFYRQRDAMDCGPACLMMVAAAHGRKYALPYLRERSFLSREGVSAQGIMDAAETIGFRTMTVKIPFDTGTDIACLLNAPLPWSVLYVVWIRFFVRRRKEMDYVRFQQSGENNNTLIEMIQGMQEIKLQGSERKRRWIWTGIQAKLFNTNIRSLNLMQWQEAGSGFINQGKNIFIAFLAAKSVIDGQMTLGKILVVQYMVGQMDAPLQQFVGFIRAAQDAKISLERMGEIHDQPDEDSLQHFSASSTSMMPSTSVIGGKMEILSSELNLDHARDIRIEHLSFRYNQLHEDVLRDLTLSIPRGKVTAIVGTSGSGKTTLIKLLLGFYQPRAAPTIANSLCRV